MDGANNSQDYIVLLTKSAKKLKSDSRIFFDFGKNDYDFAVRIAENEEKGTYSSEWISFSQIEQFLAQQGINSFQTNALGALFQSKDNNNAGFFAAILLDSYVGLVVNDNTKFQVINNYVDKLVLLKNRIETEYHQQSSMEN